MNIIDAIIILVILFVGVVGLKRGFFNQLVMTVGLLIVYVISFKLKEPIANWMSLNFPFFNFGGLTSLNIILYQVIAFIIVFSLVMIIFRIVLKLTGAFEKILKFTIILGIPSKILGFILGLIEGYIVVFIAVFIISQPFVKSDIVAGSKYRGKILNSSPVLSNIASSTNDAIKDIYEVQKNYVDSKNLEEYNKEVVRILVEYEMVTEDYIDKLIESGKLKI